MSEKLLCNIRNVKKPIIGLIPGKRITKDELGIKLPIRQYMRIKRDCNVFAVFGDEEYIIPNGEIFNEYLEKQINAVKENKVEDNTNTEPDNHAEDSIPKETISNESQEVENVQESTETTVENEHVEETTNNDNTEEQGIEYTEEELNAINEVTNGNYSNNNSNRKNKKRR